MNETENKLTAEQAAELLNIGVRRVQQLAKSGGLAGKKHGRDWLFAHDDIVAFAASPRKRGRPKKS